MYCTSLTAYLVLFFPLGGGPVLGGRSRGVGQSRAAAAQNEALRGMPKDLSGALFCGKL